MARKRQRQQRYGTTVRTRITERVTETDTDERKRNAGNQALKGVGLRPHSVLRLPET